MSIHRDKNIKTKPYYVKFHKKTFRGFSSKNEALMFETKLKMQFEKDSPLMLSFSSVALEYLRYSHESLEYGSYQKSKNIIEKIIIPSIKDKMIIDINERDCLEFRYLLNSMKYSSVYKNDVIQRYKAVFKFACKYYGLGKDPSVVIDKFRKSYDENIKDYNRQFNVWTEEEFLQFNSHVRKENYQVFFNLLYFTGMRLGECLALTWKDYKEGSISITKNLTRKTDKGIYEIKQPKTKNSIRTIKLNQSVINMLDNYREKESSIPGFRESWFIFGRLKPFAQSSIDRVKESAIKRSGVKRIRIHDLRHSHATNLINNGVNVVAVSKRLGHSSITQTLNTYTHLLQKSDDDLINKLEQSSQKVLKSFSNMDKDKQKSL